MWNNEHQEKIMADLMVPGIAYKLNLVRKSLLGAVGMAALLGAPLLIAIASPLQICAQATVSFEVVSVKPQPWTGQGSVGAFVHGNTLSAEHCSLNDLVTFAWNLRDIQLAGGPSWAMHGPLASSDLYQVIAKAAGDPPPSTDQFRLMLQTLLADRFQLKVHHVSKDLPVYNLVAAKNGPRLKESAEDTEFSMVVDATVNGGTLTRITAKHVAIAKFLGQIEHAAPRPLIDKTGLTGFYDFVIEWTPDSPAAGPDAAASDPSGPSLFTALQNQLGLKLEPATAPFDTVVIDHAEKPSAN
jgi:bla regulator protein BlaR1